MPRRSPADTDRHDRLAPSFFSSSGFLGTDARDWEEIIADDARALQRIGVDVQHLAQALRKAYSAAVRAMGDSVELVPGVQAACLECRGRIPSPFPGEGTFAKHQVRVVDEPGGRFFVITELGLHLIERYGFFQGRGSPFRIDPVQAAEMLKLIDKRP